MKGEIFTIFICFCGSRREYRLSRKRTELNSEDFGVIIMIDF